MFIYLFVFIYYICSLVHFNDNNYTYMDYIGPIWYSNRVIVIYKLMFNVILISSHWL